MDDFEKELKTGFLEEASQGLSETEQCFLALEGHPNSTENLNTIFRLAHNLKGSSKAVGFDQMGELAHEFESFILKIKNGQLAPSAEVVSFLLSCNDFLRTMVDGLKQNFDAKFNISVWISEMHGLAEGKQASASAAAPVAPATVPAQQATFDLAVPIAAPKVAAPAPASQDESLRVAVSKLESLLNAVGEMVILQSVLREQASTSGSASLIKTVHQISKASKEIQDISMCLRMVPIKGTFQKMQRIVRDTSAELKKDVDLILSGEGAEIDKTVLEKINDPLVHLIRNSIDHGIETSDVRVQRGKSDKGEVRLSAFHEGGRFIIEVKDDGGGLNPEKLTRKAIEKGLLKEGVSLSESEAFNLIFAPGFSTKEQVTDISGRGVGMDVVRTNILGLGGEIQIHSKLGVGTTFRVVLPLTLAIIEAMIVTVNGQKYVLPMAHVHETLKPHKNQIQSTSNMGEILLLRDENLSHFKLGDFFGLRSEKKTTDMISLVIRSGIRPFALAVDDILGQSQVVVKSLAPEFQNYPGVSGTTILGDGRPAFILEPAQLFERTGKSTQNISFHRNGVAV